MKFGCGGESYIDIAIHLYPININHSIACELCELCELLFLFKHKDINDKSLPTFVTLITICG